MLSREADACFWIGRYVERAEATARMLDVHYHATLEGVPGMLEWESVLAIADCAEDFHKRHTELNERTAIEYFVFDTENSGSIVSALTYARENARSIREMVASEIWECLNMIYLELKEWDVDRALSGTPHAFFTKIKNTAHLFHGITYRTQLLNETRDWLRVGTFLERADQTVRLLDVKYHDLLPATRAGKPELGGMGVGGPADIHGWIAVLRSVSAFEMYRKTHRDGIHPAGVVDFLALNPVFPASIRYSIGQTEEALRRVSGTSPSSPATCEPERLVGRLRAELNYARADEIIVGGLHEYLQSVQKRCTEIGGSITRTYLSYQ
ncbi:alpha-E domain-containing protein [Armatimonas sp.]|uniref:alpha-E domain-containing protein n=1 Tax=Armatimonas sp. TaxID=1872638 RepID=UPI00374D22DA